ncbi:hypothetical protein RI129_008537 [Pyrocoelia pectoralis]|uniref:Uncharacterized protein n=1 Tax=Pyrocoelia pectoralis TaxID=417401 RepID=A0AAN7V5L0_9COLE
MKILRVLTGREYSDRIRNTKLRDECGIEDVVKFSTLRRKGPRPTHYGKKLPKQLLEAKSESRRSQGKREQLVLNILRRGVKEELCESLP